jgi:hypothetical protein
MTAQLSLVHGVVFGGRSPNPKESTDTTQEPRTGSAGTVIAVTHDLKMVTVSHHKEMHDE